MAYVQLAALAVSAAYGRTVESQVVPQPEPQPEPQMVIAYEELDMKRLDETVEATIGDGGSSNGDDRSTNMNFVLAVKSSSIWNEVKKRSLTIKTCVNDELVEKSPDAMSDAELARLKQACHDGLKCVVVDQLQVTQMVKQRIANGNTAVRIAITRITKVLSEYTHEYHEDTYQYEAVTEADDSDKLYQSVTTIVEDNKELCQIAPAAPATPPATPATPPAADNGEAGGNNTTINNYNTNYGTINSATVHVAADPAAKPTVVAIDTSELAPGNGAPEARGDAPQTATETRRDAPQTATETRRDAGSQTDHSLFSDNAEDSTIIVTFMPESSTEDGTPGARGGAPQTGTGSQGVASQTGTGTQGGDGGIHLNNGRNGVGAENDTDLDIAATGSQNVNTVRKGYVEDGSLNNGEMKVYNLNRGFINKGVVNKDAGTPSSIVVGNVNNGPVNTGSISGKGDNRLEFDTKNIDVKQFTTAIDKMYLAMKNGFQ